MPLARGAGWIHGIDNNPLMQWVQKLSTPTQGAYLSGLREAKRIQDIWALA